MTKFISQQFSLSTAEHALNYFSGAQSEAARPTHDVLPPGNYRVIDGVLRLVVPGVPPELSMNWVRSDAALKLDR